MRGDLRKTILGWPGGLDQHFQRLLKDWREEQQKKHGERVEERQKQIEDSSIRYRDERTQS